MEGRKKSLKLNMILNGIKGLLSVIFPLITFPYASKVLGVESVGMYNFSLSIINYLLLIAGLGIKTYAVREGTKYKDDKEKFSNFASSMFSLNLISTFLSYCIFLIVGISVPKLWDYKFILLILSIQILFTTIGVEWIFAIWENFMFITVLSIISHVISIILLFSLVHSSDDLLIYCAITSFACVLTNLFGFFAARKYCKIKIKFKFEVKKHLKPILILFATQISTTIFVSSDITILGFMCNDEVVGIYSVSSKIYSIVKGVLASVLIVSIPRLSSLYNQEKFDEFKYTSRDIYFTLITLVIPAIAGMILLRTEIVLIVADVSYIEAVKSLIILCFSMFFCLSAWFWGQCVLIPVHKENIVLFATIVGAISNIILNFILIPLWGQVAAAITTLISEGLAFAIQYFVGRKYVRLNGIIKIFIKILIGVSGIVLIWYIFSLFNLNYIINTIAVVSSSLVLYFIIEIIFKNEAMSGIVNTIKRKLHIKEYNKND